jgi:thiamine-triphosphatase
LKPLGRRSFEDVYYDRDQVLSSKGIWVRKRNEKWQAKIRQNGDYTNSQFEEVADADEISRIIRGMDLGMHTASSNFGLEEIARYTTFRETWRADNKFEIVLDATNFDHIVGEVELQQAVTLEDDNGEDALRLARQAVSADMDRQLEDFMNYYSWAFPSDKPVGKLSAYFAWKRKVAKV